MTNSIKPTLIMDQHFRRVEELFSPEDFGDLQEHCQIIGGVNWPMNATTLKANLSGASFLIAAHPLMDREDLEQANNLRAIIEVSGTFQTGLDYSYCFEHGIEVLSCAPGFQYSVAEMTLGMMLAGARGLVNEHENFRKGSENWLDDNLGTDFTLFGQDIGFIGFGAISRETARLLEPFGPKIKAFDPWLAASNTKLDNVEFCELAEIISTTRCIIVAAAPTDENYQLISKKLISKMRPGTLVIVISRSHLVDFNALIEAADNGYIRVATDVFPQEPVHHNAAIRQSRNVIFSPHRAAAVEGGRHPIGRMIVNDVKNILSGDSGRQLQPATPDRIQNIIRAPMVAGSGGQ